MYKVAVIMLQGIIIFHNVRTCAHTYLVYLCIYGSILFTHILTQDWLHLLEHM